MTNATKGEIVVTLSDSVPRVWRLNANDMAGIESVIQVRRDKKVSFIQYFGEVGSWCTDDYRLVLWAGLRHAASDLTEERVGEILGLDDMFKFQDQFIDWADRMLPERFKKKAPVPANTETQS